MYEKLRGIVLNTIRYSDKHNIVHIYTDGRGLMSFAVPIGKTPAARMRNAALMPLSLVDLEAAVRPGRELSMLREVPAQLSAGNHLQRPREECHCAVHQRAAHPCHPGARGQRPVVPLHRAIGAAAGAAARPGGQFPHLLPVSPGRPPGHPAQSGELPQGVLV